MATGTARLFALWGVLRREDVDPSEPCPAPESMFMYIICHRAVLALFVGQVTLQVAKALLDRGPQEQAGVLVR